MASSAPGKKREIWHPRLPACAARLSNGDGADRRFVHVLSARRTDGLEPVEVAVHDGLVMGTASDDLIFTIRA